MVILFWIRWPITLCSGKALVRGFTRCSLSSRNIFRIPNEVTKFCYYPLGLWIWILATTSGGPGIPKRPFAVLKAIDLSSSSVYTLQSFAANHRLRFTSALWHVSGNRLIETKLDWGFGRKSQRHYNEHVHVAILLPQLSTNQQGMRQKGKYKEGKCWSSSRGEGIRQGAKEPRHYYSGCCWHIAHARTEHTYLFLYCWSPSMCGKEPSSTHAILNLFQKIMINSIM